MSALAVRYPIRTLTGQELLAAGTELTDDLLDSVIASNTKTPYPVHAFLNYASVRKDLFALLSDTPYYSMFGGLEQMQTVLAAMERVRLVLPLLESLDYFREQDFYTYRHILIVFALTTLLARELISDDRVLTQEIAAGPTHDFGKICVPVEVLKKTTPLTTHERRRLEHHAAAGFLLLCFYLQDKSSLAARTARDHHERNNGSGYPRGVLNADPLVEIVAVADVYDALISSRPYRRVSYDNRTALEEITKMAQRGEIGWDVVRTLVAQNRKGRPHYSRVKISEQMRGTPPLENVYGVTIDP